MHNKEGDGMTRDEVRMIEGLLGKSRGVFSAGEQVFVAFESQGEAAVFRSILQRIRSDSRDITLLASGF